MTNRTGEQLRPRLELLVRNPVHRVHVLRLHQPRRVIARLRLSPRADDDDDIEVEIAALHGVLH